MNKYEIIDLHLRGMSIRKISKLLGISRNTVSKYIEKYENDISLLMDENQTLDKRIIIESIVEEPRYDTSNRKPSKYNEEIDILLDQILADEEKKNERIGSHHKQKLSKSQIHQLVIEAGYDIGLTTISRKINEKRNKNKEAYIKQEYPYGQRFEYDFGEVKLVINGECKKKYLAVISSPASGFRWAYLYHNSKMDVFIDSQVKFFDMVKGSYEEGVYDNMRNVVSKFVGRNEKEINRELLKLATYYGFSINVTNCFSGNEKGTVESAVKWIRNKVFAIRYEFDTFEEAEAYLQKQLVKINEGSSIDEEMKYLKPYRPKYESAHIESRLVDKYSFIKVDANFYSVPDYLVDKNVLVKIYPNNIDVYYKQDKVATHIRDTGKNKTCIDINHYLDTFLKKPGALRNSTALKSVPELKDIFDKYYKENPRSFISKLNENMNLELNELIEVLKPDYQKINEDNNWVKEETMKQILEISKLFTGGKKDGLIH
ncbi:MAG: IS21 family transposase [Erysipelotrichaceae bacterium]